MENPVPLPSFHRSPLGIGQILDGSLKTYRRHLALLFGMIFGVYFITLAISMLVQWAGGIRVAEIEQIADNYDYSSGDGAEILALFLRFIPVLAFVFIVNYAMYTIGEGMLIQAADNIYTQGKPGRVAKILRRLSPRLPRLLFTVLLRDLLVILPTLLCVVIMGAMIVASMAVGEAAMVVAIVAGVLLLGVGILITLFLNVVFVLTPVVVISEGQGYWAAIKRSWQLLKMKDPNSSPKRHLFRMSLILLVFFAFNMVASTFAGAVYMLFGVQQMGDIFSGQQTQFEYNFWQETIGQIVALTLSAVIAAPMWVAFVILYFDIRMRHEGYDLARAAEVSTEPLSYN